MSELNEFTVFRRTLTENLLLRFVPGDIAIRGRFILRWWVGTISDCYEDWPLGRGTESVQLINEMKLMQMKLNQSDFFTKLLYIKK